jgi:hypothetical protein
VPRFDFVASFQIYAFANVEVRAFRQVLRLRAVQKLIKSLPVGFLAKFALNVSGIRPGSPTRSDMRGPKHPHEIYETRPSRHDFPSFRSVPQFPNVPCDMRTSRRTSRTSITQMTSVYGGLCVVV